MYDDYREVETNNNNKPEGGKPKAPFWKKALAAIALGLLFGAFAGAGIYVAGLISGTGTLGKTDKPAVQAESSEPATVATESAATAETAEAKDSDTKNTIQTVTTTTTARPAGVLDVSDVAENVMPAVVSITTNYVQTAQDIFGQRYKSESKAAGSGIIVGDNGTELLVVTNQHVVNDAEKLAIQFIDGSEAEAKVKGEDESSDVAVIAIEKSQLSADTQKQIKIATLGDSDSLKVGQAAIAIGNAMGYGQSVTAGVISAVNREVTLQNGTHKLIQTDATINPGNSGGALVDINGNVIGINEAKTNVEYAENMCYAIPISDVRNIIDNLMNQATKEKASDKERGYLGISGVDVTLEVSEQYNMPRGVYIAKVGSGLAADNAGIKAKSIITSFDGQGIQTMEQLQSLMDYYRIGDEVEVVVQQPTENDYGYEEKTFKVKLGGSMSMTTNSDTNEEAEEQEPEDNGQEESEPEDNGDQQGPGSVFYGDDIFNDIFGDFMR